MMYPGDIDERKNQGTGMICVCRRFQPDHESRAGNGPVFLLIEPAAAFTTRPGNRPQG